MKKNNKNYLKNENSKRYSIDELHYIEADLFNQIYRLN